MAIYCYVPCPRKQCPPMGKRAHIRRRSARRCSLLPRNSRRWLGKRKENYRETFPFERESTAGDCQRVNVLFPCRGASATALEQRAAAVALHGDTNKVVRERGRLACSLTTKGGPSVGALKCNKKPRQGAINVEFRSYNNILASLNNTAFVFIYSSLEMSVSRVYSLYYH